MIQILTDPIEGPERLKEALQDAIRLELATIPPYLTALLTLTGTNPSVVYARRLIKDIVVEEMLHLTLVCNILNAIGGSPVLNAPDVVPTYPGPLPMAIAGIEVHLKRYSKAQVRDIFMQIEKPETPLDIPVEITALDVELGPRTIGEFYHAIGAEITRLGDALFVDAPRRQVALGLFDPTEEISVTNVDTALSAIETIVQQGEGTTQTPRDLQSDIAHYYRFQELEKGMKLIASAQSATGVSFDPQQPVTISDDSDVVDMVDNPQLLPIEPADADAAQLSDRCDRIYSGMLDKLHSGFNGAPDDVNMALVDMHSFRSAARDLLGQRLTAGPSAGRFAGPRFLYAP